MATPPADGHKPILWHSNIIFHNVWWVILAPDQHSSLQSTLFWRCMSEWSPWGTPVLWVIPQAPVLSFFIKNSPLPGPSEVPRSPDRYPIISPYFPICFSINYKNSPTWKNVRPFEDDSTIMSTIPVISIFPESLIDRHITTGMMYQWYPQLWCLYNLCIYIYLYKYNVI